MLADSSNLASRFVLLVIVGIIGVVLLMMVAAPALGSVRLRSHAVEKHGNDALMARLVTRTCAPWAWVCPAQRGNPPCFFLVCQDSRGNRCAVMIVGTRGAELTSYITTCDRVFGLMSACERTEVEQVP